MMHAKSESDMTSLEPSSPRSPKRAAAAAAAALYFVQSPPSSRDSHDGDKSSSSIHAATSTPTYHSSTDSPSHPSSYARHSLASSASRFSGTFRKAASRRRAPWSDCPVIDEAGYDELYGGTQAGSSRRCQCLIALLGIAGVFAMFCLLIWGASRPYNIQVAVKSLTVNDFYFGQGSDLTGVPTKLMTVNCSLKMNVHNPATFFGVHVSTASVNLMYSQIAVATGQLKKYYQPRKSRRTVWVKLEGDNVPLYGAGAELAASEIDGGVPFKLLLSIRSRGNVVGALVRSKHRRRVSCQVVINSRDTKVVKFKDGSCTYD